jgi:cytoskeletal protein CcmA (bactofilin family)
MGVKNNFSQAVSELIGISRAAEPEAEEEPENGEMEDAQTEEVKTETVDSLINEQNEAEEESCGSPAVMKVAAPASRNAVNPSKERIMAMLAQQQTQSLPQTVQEEEELQVQETQVQETQDAVQEAQQPQTQFGKSFSQEPKEAPGLTTIAKGTVIIGEINAEGDVALLGSVKGKVISQGDIKANGKVMGDLAGRDIELVACAVQGNIVASGLVNVDGDSVVVGDVKAENFCLDGKIKGNVTVEKEAKFQAKAILAGNVTTASIAMSQGAKIQGEVNIPLNEKETDMSFDLDFKI